MARPLRIEYDGAWYHVMNRGWERRKTFLYSAHYEYFLSLLKDISKIYKIQIHAYSLMPNHQIGVKSCFLHFEGLLINIPTNQD